MEEIKLAHFTAGIRIMDPKSHSLRLEIFFNEHNIRSYFLSQNLESVRAQLDWDTVRYVSKIKCS